MYYSEAAALTKKDTPKHLESKHKQNHAYPDILDNHMEQWNREMKVVIINILILVSCFRECREKLDYYSSFDLKNPGWYLYVW